MSSSSHEKIDQLASRYGSGFTPDVEKGLTRLHATIHRGPSVRTAKVRTLPRRQWLSIAAGVLLVIFAGLFYFANDGTTVTNSSADALAYELPDGTQVMLQQGSTISFDGAYAGAERRVDIKGQAFFQVAKDAEKPFLVTAGSTTLRVTGTAFNLRVEEDAELEVEVSEGSVELTYADLIIPIAARQCGLVKAGEAPVMMEAPNLNRHAWRTGKLVFENTPASEVITTLKNNWAVDVTLPPNCDFPFSSTFEHVTPAEVLHSLAKTSGGKVVQSEENSYQLQDVCDQ